MSEHPSTSEVRQELFDEFSLIQGKIDKVGDFLFKVKAWSISLTTAVLIGGASEKVPNWVVLLGLIAIFGFWLLELNQRLWKTAFQERVREIDDQLRRIDVRSSPQRASDWAKSSRTGRPQSLVQAINKVSRKDGMWHWLVMRAFGIFYVLQVALVLITALIMSFSASEKPAEDMSDKPSKPLLIQFENAIDAIIHGKLTAEVSPPRIIEVVATPELSKVVVVPEQPVKNNDARLDESRSPEADRPDNSQGESTLNDSSPTSTRGTD